jgi:hypothetical protein
MINAQATDIHARGAYDGTSWSPEQREASAIQEYVNHMSAVAQEFTQWNTADNNAAMVADLEEYRARYAAKYNAYLAAHSRVVSTFITGGSGWTASRVRTNEKRNNSTDNRLTELLEYSQKQLKRLRARYNPRLIAARPISANDPDAIERLEEKIEKLEEHQALMKAVNKLVRLKVADEEKVQQICEFTGWQTTTAWKLLQHDFCGRVGFPGYELTNNNANIQRLKGRVEELKQRAAIVATQTEDVTKEVNGVTYVENTYNNRVQLIFPGKPDYSVIRELKSRGFHWSPSEGAWQRQLNNAGIYAAQYIFGLVTGTTTEITRPITSEDTAMSDDLAYLDAICEPIRA